MTEKTSEQRQLEILRAGTYDAMQTATDAAKTAHRAQWMSALALMLVVALTVVNILLSR